MAGVGLVRAKVANVHLVSSSSAVFSILSKVIGIPVAGQFTCLVAALPVPLPYLTAWLGGESLHLQRYLDARFSTSVSAVAPI